ncbi:MAG: hypothetical protein BWY81_00891 [Firmicutes bacterium ADurb.Bin467]|nr:MAG: hypothetical protein BWY81_00891 [Firmicutes bacterium ADurb.Bin467]
MQLLPVAAEPNALHQYLLGRHERQVLAHALPDHRRVDDHAGGDVRVQFEHGVGRQERLGQRKAAVRAVVERALEPLRRGGHLRVLQKRHYVPGERADALGAHRVSLVGHRGRADLAGLERLLDLAERLQEPQILRELVRALGDAGERREHAAVELAGVGLAGDVEALLEPELCGDPLFELVDLLPVAVEQLQKALLRAGRAAISEQFQRLPREVDAFEVHQKVLHPERRALADRRQLRGLQVRVAERRERAVFPRERAQPSQHLGELFADERERVVQHQNVGVVGHVAGRRAQVDHAARAGARIGVGEHVRHHVVARALLVTGRGLVVDVKDVLPELLDLRFRHGQAHLHLALGERDPEPAPGRELAVGREDLLHLPARVAAVERRFVAVAHGNSPALPDD